MKTTQTFSILIWANKSKEVKGEIPIMARITINGKRSEISLQKKIAVEKWDATAGRVKGNNEEARTINHHIKQAESGLYKIYTQMQVLDEFITSESIKNKYQGVSEERKTILQVFDYHNSQMESVVGIDVVPATLVKFRTIRTKISSFIRYKYKKSDLFLEELKVSFLSDFEFYLKTQEHIQHNTTMKYIQNFKKIVHLAQRNEWLQRDPFADFHCSFRKVDRNVLSSTELQLLEEKEFTFRRLQTVKDLFVFSCYTGLAYIDVMSLSPANIAMGIDGNYWIFTERHKTSEKVRVPLLPPAMKILEKYRNSPDVINRNAVLPHLSNQKLNAYLKEIADLCEIEKKLTFHLARHTFATTVTLSNGVPLETVSKLLGHSNIKTTQIYAKVLENKISDDMNCLREKLFRKPPQKLSNY
jgi:site-specific recombinase XerD